MTPEELDRMAKSHFDDMVYPGNMESDAVCDKHNLGLLEHLARAVAVAVLDEVRQRIKVRAVAGMHGVLMALNDVTDAIERGEKKEGKAHE
jgi:hypothetical protein